jgi:heme/copper-type cytochrome/quinol oxidase subunit 3
MSTESLVNKEAFAPEEPHEFGDRWRTGALLLILADAAFVAALSFTYLYLRALDTQHSFHPGDTGVASLWWPWTVSAVTCLSALAYWNGFRVHQPGRRYFVGGATVAVMGMTVALVLTIIQMYRFPFTVSDNAYAAAVWVIAAGSVFHLVITVFLGLGIAIRVNRRATRGARDWHVRIVGIWFAWVCVASIVGALTITVANGTVGCPLPKDQPDPGARSVVASSCPTSAR